MLRSVGYTSNATLEVEFLGGAVYRYFAVPRSLFEDLMLADSKGAFFNRRIKPRFHYQRIA
jgi:hypothetical protein